MDSRTRLETLTRTLSNYLEVVPEGTLLGDCFLIDLEHPLGAGGQGAVFPGVHTQLELPVAVKVFGAEEIEDERLAKRFVQEARILAQLNSPDVVRVWDLNWIEEAGIYYLVTEFVRGASLDLAVASTGRALSETEGVATAVACARGLAAMHEAGIIHRDFKPGNALWQAGSERVKVCDLGLAKEARVDDVGGLTTMGETFGSPAYMAPEQARGARGVGPRADVYSLGAILYFLLTGEAPASMTSLQEIIDGGPKAEARQGKIEDTLDDRGVSLRTKGLVIQMLSKKAEDRPDDATVALMLLEHLLADIPGADQVRLARTFASSPLTRAMEIELTYEPGTLWRPARTQATTELFLDTVRIDTPPQAPKVAPGIETQFWEEAFPILKEDREKEEEDTVT